MNSEKTGPKLGEPEYQQVTNRWLIVQCCALWLAFFCSQIALWVTISTVRSLRSELKQHQSAPTELQQRHLADAERPVGFAGVGTSAGHDDGRSVSSFCSVVSCRRLGYAR